MTPYAQPIDLVWVERLEERKDLGEKIDAFVSRYARLQDHLGEKLLPAYARLLGGQPKTLLDVLAYAERVVWLDSAAEFVGSRRLRNLLVHEYMQSPALFLEALLSAKPATEMLMSLVERIARLAVELGISESRSA